MKYNLQMFVLGFVLIPIAMAFLIGALAVGLLPLIIGIYVQGPDHSLWWFIIEIAWLCTIMGIVMVRNS